jgi:hypothetical protein
VTKVSRDVIEVSSGPDSGNDLVNWNVHCVRGKLFPGHVARPVDDKDRVAVNRAHIHTAGKSEDPEAGTEDMSTILEDREP